MTRVDRPNRADCRRAAMMAKLLGAVTQFRTDFGRAREDSPADLHAMALLFAACFCGYRIGAPAEDTADSEELAEQVLATAEKWAEERLRKRTV